MEKLAQRWSRHFTALNVNGATWADALAVEMLTSSRPGVERGQELYQGLTSFAQALLDEQLDLLEATPVGKQGEWAIRHARQEP